MGVGGQFGGSNARKSTTTKASSNKYSAPLLERAKAYVQALTRMDPDRQPEAHVQSAETEWRRQQDIQAAMKTMADVMVAVINDLRDFGMYEDNQFFQQVLEEESEPPPPPYQQKNWFQWLQMWQKWWLYLIRKDKELQGYWKAKWATDAAIDARLDAMFWSAYDKFKSIDLNYYTKADLDGGALDGRYYTETEIDTMLADYYTAAQLDAGQLDTLYFRETEFINSSAGAGDAGKPIVLDSFGMIDPSMYVGGGVTDHGALTGLLDDDHTQYHNDTRGDLRYYTQALLDAGQLDSRYYTQAQINAALLLYVLVDGTRDFTGKVKGVSTVGGDPATTLTTKDYVDGVAGGVTDHGALTGLLDDDHTQYSPIDGTRAFTGKVRGLSTTTSDAATTLATKSYVDYFREAREEVPSGSFNVGPLETSKNVPYYKAMLVTSPFSVDSSGNITIKEPGRWDISCHVTVASRQDDPPAGALGVKVVLEEETSPGHWHAVPDATAYWRA